MSITLGIAIYVVIWWTVLFAVLPIGVRTQESAPTAPRLLRVVLLTTVIATLLFLLPWAVTRYGLVDLGAWIGRDLPK